MRTTALFVVSLVVPTLASAQLAQGAPEFTEAEEIALARSAAPPAVSSEATVLILRDGTYQKARTGTNGVTCMVSRSQPLSIEPICYDPEATRTVLPREIRLVEMRLAGASEDEVDRAIAKGIETGELLLSERPALAYMLSAGQVLYADAERRVGAFYPHVHFYWPYATEDMFGGLATDPSGTVLITDPGEATASLIVIANEFVAVEGGGTEP